MASIAQAHRRHSEPDDGVESPSATTATTATAPENHHSNEVTDVVVDSPSAATTTTTTTTAPPLRHRKLTILENTPPSAALNPFSNRTPDLSACTKATLMVSGVVLAPLRLVTLIIAITLMCIFGNLAIMGLSEEGLNKPLACWRKVLRSPAVFGVRLLLFSQGVWWIVEKGHRASAAEAPIVVANHMTFLDIMVIWSTRAAAVSKADNKDIPVMGALAKSFQFIFVDRADKDSRSKTAAEIRRRAADPRWAQTVIFPEGTTSNGTAVIAFKNGPFAPGRPVLPVAIKYHWKRWGVDPSWVLGRPQMGALGLRLLCVPSVAVTLQYLPVLYPSEAEKADAALFAARAQETLAKALGVPKTLHSFDDVRLAYAAYRKHRLPVAAGVTEFKAMKSALNDIDVDTAKLYLERFAALGGSKDGLVSKEVFARVLLMTPQPPPPPPPQEQPPQTLESREAQQVALEDGREVKLKNGEAQVAGFTGEEIDRLFTLLDVSETGFLDFREFLVMMTFVNGSSVENRSAALRLAFRVFDEGDTGKISKTVLMDILRRGLPDLSPEELAKLAQGADGDKDGQVTYEAFLAFAEAHADQLPAFKSCFFGGVSGGLDVV